MPFLSWQRKSNAWYFCPLFKRTHISGDFMKNLLIKKLAVGQMLYGRKLKLVHAKGQQYTDVSTAEHFLVMTHLMR
jgi:hypothetical protein